MFDTAIKKYSRIYKVNQALIKAIIKVESNFNPEAIRYEKNVRDFSVGLMQVRLDTARWILKNDGIDKGTLLIPDVNIMAGTAYLSYQKKRYSGNTKDIIASYNAGTAKRRTNGKYVNQAYVNKALKWYNIYKAKQYAMYAIIPLFLVGYMFISDGGKQIEK